MSKEIVLDTDEGLVEYRTDIKGWVGKNGRFYGENKNMGISDNSTHKTCSEGHVYGKSWISCPKCSEDGGLKRYLDLPVIEWDEETPIMSYDNDTFFKDIEEVIEYLENDEDITLEDLRLVICTPNHLNEVNSEFWSDIIPEEHDLKDIVSEEFNKKLAELNEIIDKHGPISWGAGYKRVDLRKNIEDYGK